MIDTFFWAVLRQNLLHAAPNTLLLHKINKSQKTAKNEMNVQLPDMKSR